jgi:hypothetical protein
MEKVMVAEIGGPVGAEGALEVMEAFLDKMVLKLACGTSRPLWTRYVSAWCLITLRSSSDKWVR